MATGSTKVVYAALAGNLLVAAAKFAAATVSGSSAMLTEAVHSLADSANQVLLLVGTWRSRHRADATHRFGYGMEIYFWTFVVAVIVFLAGGVVGIQHGLAQLRHPEPIASPGLSLAVLAVAAVFEGVSFGFGYREYRRVVDRYPVRGNPVTVWRFIALSKDPNLYETLLEDAAALAGLAIAAAGIVGSAWFGLPWADGAASLAIGTMLIGASLVVAEATRSLIAGESVAPPLQRELARVVEGHVGPLGLSELKTLHLGPRRILVALTVEARERQQTATTERLLEELTQALRGVDSRVVDVYFRFKS
jgi:cation diffusion facilitator family transporter